MSTVSAPFLAPIGYDKRDIVMADPMNPGSDLPNPALMNPAGEPVGFSGTRSMVSARYVAFDDSAIDDAALACEFSGVVLVADEPEGVTLDPDGVETEARLCRDTSGAGSGLEGDPVPRIDLDACESSPIPQPVVSVG
ncbi:hypothetical protein [Demequina sp. NBRC 110051]|uniref:hypothetical protein n=1 Tax=Demequina sp. NBRC 110051 TaxID=1570340 RepID=UPI00117D2F0F|nr:hypothetical protein [Demequina sp. NBRC 110051]